MKSFETIGTKLLYNDNGYTCRNAEVIMKVEFVGKEIVRCKDCKWWHKDGVCRMLSNNHYPVVYMDDDDFCSRGRRKDELEE